MERNKEELTNMNLQETIKELDREFEEFKCIQGDCDGKGHCPVQISEDEVEDNQCQFHAEYLFPIAKYLKARDKRIIKATIEALEKHVDDMGYYSTRDVLGDKGKEILKQLN